MSKLIQEFKDFAVKGNAVDMAVGVIIGGAFGKIVSSIVDDIIMPPIGWLIGGVKFTDLKFTLPTVDIPGVEKYQQTVKEERGRGCRSGTRPEADKRGETPHRDTRPAEEAVDTVNVKNHRATRRCVKT